MKCRQAQKLLPLHQDHDLAPEQVEAVEQHLESCDDCSAELAKLDSVMALIGGLREVEPPADFTGNVLAAIAADPEFEPVEASEEAPAVGLWLGVVGLAVSLIGLFTVTVAWPTGITSVALPALRAVGDLVSLTASVALDLFDALLRATYVHGPWILAVHMALLLIVHVAWKRLKPAEEAPTPLAA